MAWELLAIWTIVIMTIVWFFRDERRQVGERLQRHAEHFALAPAYRYQTPDRPAQPTSVNRAEYAENRRRFMKALERQSF